MLAEQSDLRWSDGKLETRAACRGTCSQTVGIMLQYTRTVRQTNPTATAPPGPSVQWDSWQSTAPLPHFSAWGPWPASQRPTPSSDGWPWCQSVSSAPGARAHTMKGQSWNTDTNYLKKKNIVMLTSHVEIPQNQEVAIAQHRWLPASVSPGLATV